MFTNNFYATNQAAVKSSLGVLACGSLYAGMLRSSDISSFKLQFVSSVLEQVQYRNKNHKLRFY
jgi:hypothetical protein